MIYHQTVVLLSIIFILMLVEVQTLDTVHTNIYAATDRIKPIINSIFFQGVEENSDLFSQSDAELSARPW